MNEYSKIEPREWSTTVCGGDVRWSKKTGKLQQRFVVTDYVGSSPSGSRQEWRDVPIFDDHQKGAGMKDKELKYQ